MTIHLANSIFQDLSSLKHFYSIAINGGFSKAARSTGTSQPALSLGLQKLEKTLGVTLVDRQAKTFALTAEGVSVLSFCQKLEHSLQSMIGNFDSQEFTVRQQMRIGTALSVGFEPLLKACWSIANDEKRIELELSSDSTYVLLKGVLEGSLDAAIVPDDVQSNGIAVTKLMEDQIIFVVGRSWSKVITRKAWPQCLENIPLITYPREAPMRSLVDRLCLQNKLQFKTLISVNGVDALKLVVGSESGGAFVLRSLVVSELKTGEYCEVRPPFTLPKSAIMLATRTGDHGYFLAKQVKELMGLKER